MLSGREAYRIRERGWHKCRLDYVIINKPISTASCRMELINYDCNQLHYIPFRYNYYLGWYILIVGHI